MPALDFEETSSQLTRRSTRVHSSSTAWTYMCWSKVEDTVRGAQGQGFLGNGDTTAGHCLAAAVNVDQAPDQWGGIFHGVAWLSSGTTPNGGTWTHYAATRRDGTTFLYKDGVQETGTETTAPSTPTDTGFLVGKCGAWTGSTFADGIIALVKVWDKALTTDEILLEMRSYYPIVSGCVAFYPLDEGSGSTQTDPMRFTTTDLANDANAPTWTGDVPLVFRPIRNLSFMGVG